LLGEQPVQNDYEIEAVLTAYSGENIVNDEVKVHYWINDGTLQEMVMTFEGDNLYSATFSDIQEGSEVKYYISAEDEGGFTANHPFIGEPDPHVFYAGEQLFPAIALDVTEINAWVNQGEIDVEEFIISNNGDIGLNYSITYTSAIFEDYSYTVEDSPGQSAWNSNTFNELGWVEFEVDDVVGEIGGWSIDFHWETDNWPEEGTLRAESPDGTETIIAAGLQIGDYSIDVDQFNGESMQGTWKLWITDTYGDGGHQATDIEVTITKTYTIYPWLTVEPTEGTIDPTGSQTVQITCNGTVLPLGDYEGTIWVTSNDPDFSTIEIPVYFTVDFASDVVSMENGQIEVKNYPNPFKGSTTFELNLPEAAYVELEVYNYNGQKVQTLIQDKIASGLHQISWNGENNSGNPLTSGIYFYRVRIGDFETQKKIILLNE
jgi:hypothetical protein